MWILGLQYKAGETFLSEYSAIIMMRWTIVLVFEFQLLIEVFRVIISMLELSIYSLRRVASFAGDLKRRRSRNTDGTFASESEIDRRPGRPRKR